MANSLGAQRIILSVSSILVSMFIEAVSQGELSNSRKAESCTKFSQRNFSYNRGQSGGQVVKKNWPFILLGFKGASFGWPLPVLWEQGREAWNTNISLSFTSHTADRMEGVGIPEQARHGIVKAYGYSAILLKINTFGVASSSRLGDLLML